MKAISLWQPWPWLIFRPDIQGDRRFVLNPRTAKDVENRPVHFKFTGDLCICSTQKLDPQIETIRKRVYDENGITLPDTFDCGGIVGVVVVGPMVNAHKSPWFTGPWAWPILKRRVIPFKAMRGAQGLYNLKPQFDQYIIRELVKL
jgi:hypothetical protein